MKNLSLNMKLWLYAVCCLGLAAYLGYGFYEDTWKGYREEISQLNRQIEIKKADLKKIISQALRKEQLAQEIAQAEKSFKELKEMFPDRDFIPKRLQDLNRASRNASVSPVSFRPLSVEEKEFYMENNYEIRVSSSYHGLGSFLEEIANFKYPTTITNVSLQQTETAKHPENYSSQDPSFHTINTTFHLKTFTSK